jgi:hypothetical protein
MIPDAKFLHNMGTASIVAGVILLGLAQLKRRA